MIRKRNRELCINCDLIKIIIASMSESGRFTEVNKEELDIFKIAVNKRILGDFDEELDLEKEWWSEYGIQICVNITKDKEGIDHVHKACWCGSKGIEKFKTGIKKARAQLYTAVKL